MTPASSGARSASPLPGARTPAAPSGPAAATPPGREMAIVCRGISKRYKIYKKSAHRVLEALSFHKLHLHQDLWALTDVTLDLPAGTALGVVGSNGAGKSTLLKILTRTTYPSFGTFSVNGKVSALLELGAGFHPDFSGRDNIYMNAALLGFTRQEIEERYQAIVDFSELGEFIERPVRIYSSGMYMRLGFSIAMAMDPEIIIIDEILAVGDQHFQKKCIDKIHEYRDDGRTILFCSHTLYHVRQICDRAIWLLDGRVHRDGSPIDVTNEYSAYERRRTKDAMRWMDHRPDEKAARHKEYPSLTKILFTRMGSKTPVEVVKTGDDVDVHVWYEMPDKSIDFNIGVAINRVDNIQCFGASCNHDEVAIDKTGYAVFHIKSLPLLAGEFNVAVYIADEKSLVIYDQNIDEVSFKVEYQGYELGLFRAQIEWGFIEDDAPKGGRAK